MLSLIVYVIGSFICVSTLFSLAVWIYYTNIPLSRLSRYRSVNGRSWALITGASDGIGRGFARVLAREGFGVVLVGRSGEKLGLVAAEIDGEAGCSVTRVVVSEASDLSDENFDNILEKVSDLDISILVNNVGVGHGPKYVGDMSPSQIRDITSINCTYPVLLTAKLLPHLLSKQSSTTTRSTAILNISSIAAHIHSPGVTLYSATKSFNRAFSRGLGAEYAAQGIDVLAVCPGYVATEMTKMGVSAVCCGAEECAEGALRMLVGSRWWYVECIPHYKHSIIWATTSLLAALLPPRLLDLLLGSTVQVTLKDNIVKNAK